jgi:hypothetical protein
MTIDMDRVLLERFAAQDDLGGAPDFADVRRRARRHQHRRLGVPRLGRWNFAPRRRLVVVLLACATSLAAAGAAASLALHWRISALHWGSNAPRHTVIVSTPTAPVTIPALPAEYGDAATRMSVFDSSTPAATLPTAMQAFAPHWLDHGAPYGQLELSRARLLTSQRGWQVYGIPTTHGLVCWAVTNGSSTGGQCLAHLPADAPAHPSVSQDSATAPVIVAGIAADGVKSIDATTNHGTLCSAVVENNGFLCIAAPATKAPGATGLSAITADSVTGFRIWLRNGDELRIEP